MPTLSTNEDNQGFRLYRKIMPNEFIIAFGDCSQGGEDANFVVFMSKTYSDIPLVFQKQGVAAEATPFIREALNWIHGKTKVKPIVALERNNGGSSEMSNLITYNEGHYRIYYMKGEDGKPNGEKPGWDTTGGVNGTGTRPKMLGDWLMAYESKAIRIYDEIIQEQHQTFIVNKNGKPEAAPNTHDDAVMACAGAWQLFKTENVVTKIHRRTEAKRLKMHVGGR